MNSEQHDTDQDEANRCGTKKYETHENHTNLDNKSTQYSKQQQQWNEKKFKTNKKMDWNDYGEQKISEMIFNTTNAFVKNENRSR